MHPAYAVTLGQDSIVNMIFPLTKMTAKRNNRSLSASILFQKYEYVVSQKPILCILYRKHLSQSCATIVYFLGAAVLRLISFFSFQECRLRSRRSDEASWSRYTRVNTSCPRRD